MIMNPTHDIPNDPTQASDERFAVAAPRATAPTASTEGHAPGRCCDPQPRRLRYATGTPAAPQIGSVAPVQTGPTLEKLETLEAAMLKMPQADCPVTNLFAPGIYWREIEIPAGAVALGHEHKTEHLNVLLSGRVRVLCDGQVKELVAPCVFSSSAGVRKLVYAVEPTRWANVHANPTDETEMAKLELIFIEKSAAFLAHQHHREIEKLLGTGGGGSATGDRTLNAIELRAAGAARLADGDVRPTRRRDACATERSE